MIESIPDASADNLEDVTLEIPDDIPSVNEVEHLLVSKIKKRSLMLHYFVSYPVGNDITA